MFRFKLVLLSIVVFSCDIELSVHVFVYVYVNLCSSRILVKESNFDSEWKIFAFKL